MGKSTPEHLDIRGVHALHIKAMGSGVRQMCQTDKRGFPEKLRQRQKRYFGVQTGDIVRAKQKHIRRVTVRAKGDFYIQREGKRIGFSYKYCRILQKNDGYQYQSLGDRRKPPVVKQEASS